VQRQLVFLVVSACRVGGTKPTRGRGIQTKQRHKEGEDDVTMQGNQLETKTLNTFLFAITMSSGLVYLLNVRS